MTRMRGTTVWRRIGGDGDPMGVIGCGSGCAGGCSSVASLMGIIVLFKYRLRIGGGVAQRRRRREVDGNFV